MSATFSWRQTYGDSSASTKNYDTGNVVNFFGGTASDHTAVRDAATGTANYNNTGSNIQAGSNSWPIWMQFFFTTAGAGTFNNLKFWRYTTAGFAGTGTTGANIVGTTQAAFSTPANRATHTDLAGNTAVPTSNSSTTAPGSPLTLGTVGTNAAATLKSPTYVAYQFTTATTAGAGDTGYFLMAPYIRKIVSKLRKLQEHLKEIFETICSETQKWGRSETIIGASFL